MNINVLYVVEWQLLVMQLSLLIWSLFFEEAMATLIQILNAK